MIEPVIVDCIASAGHRSDHAEAGHIAGGDEECARPTSELRQRLFQRVMRALVAGDEMRGAAAHSVFIRAGLECGDYRRMVREAEIIVAAKREIAYAVDDDLGALRTIDHGTRAVLMLRAQRSERGGQAFHRGMPKWIADTKLTEESRAPSRRHRRGPRLFSPARAHAVAET